MKSKLIELTDGSKLEVKVILHAVSGEKEWLRRNWMEEMT